MIDIAKIHTLEFFKAGGVYTGNAAIQDLQNR